MTLNDTTIRALQTLVADGKRRRPDLASRIERALTVLLFREREYLGCGAYSIAGERPDTYYIVTRQSCTCPDATERGMTCKHQLAVGLLEQVEREEQEREQREVADLLQHFAPRPAATAAG